MQIIHGTHLWLNEMFMQKDLLRDRKNKDLSISHFFFSFNWETQSGIHIAKKIIRQEIYVEKVLCLVSYRIYYFYDFTGYLSLQMKRFQCGYCKAIKLRMFPITNENTWNKENFVVKM